MPMSKEWPWTKPARCTNVWYIDTQTSYLAFVVCQFGVLEAHIIVSTERAIVEQIRYVCHEKSDILAAFYNWTYTKFCLVCHVGSHFKNP